MLLLTQQILSTCTAKNPIILGTSYTIMLSRGTHLDNDVLTRVFFVEPSTERVNETLYTLEKISERS